MSILLSDERKNNLYCTGCTSKHGCDINCEGFIMAENLAKAATIHAVQYLMEPCTEHPCDGNDPYEHDLYRAGGHTYFSHRWECDACMAKVYKELGIEVQQ